MELGNLIFGNSRGEYHLPRDNWVSDPWESFIDMFPSAKENMGYRGFRPSDDDMLLFGLKDIRSETQTWGNEVFEVTPYLWDPICDCGYDDYCEAAPEHEAGCPVTKFKQFLDVRFLDGKLLEQIVHEFKQKHPEIKFNGEKGWLEKPICNCDYQERYNQYFAAGPDGHSETCIVSTPNFLFKPTGFTINWYKYPFRDSYANQELTKKDWNSIMNSCKLSLGVKNV